MNSQSMYIHMFLCADMCINICVYIFIYIYVLRLMFIDLVKCNMWSCCAGLSYMMKTKEKARSISELLFRVLT